MMKKNLLVLYLCNFLYVAACTPSRLPASTNDKPIAFPGAEGYGKYATGGRGGKIFIVSNLEDDGEGSFRKAVTAKGARIVVFSVSGTIHLKSQVNIRGDITIAGQTAPGDGICIADHPVSLSGNNIIIRYIRFRLGDRYQNKGKVPGSGHDDALSGYRRSNIMIDHCSFSWSTDECFSIYGGDSTTLQWNIISEPLNYSYHFEAGNTDFEKHGYGGIWGGKHLTAHHNLFAHCNNRNPRFDGIRNTGSEFVDYRNNVIYNWGSNTIYAGEGGNYNIINNYFKYGPTTNKSARFRIASPGRREEAPAIPFGKWHVSGNHVDEAAEVTNNNHLGIYMGNGGTAEDKKNTLVDKAFSAEEITFQNALDSYDAVLRSAGASYSRDTLDTRVINDVKNRTGKLIDVQGGFPHGTPYEQSKIAWPFLRSLAAPLDSDKDGMPDDWEIKNKLDPHDASDHSKVSNHSFYTNIELYLNSLLK